MTLHPATAATIMEVLPADFSIRRGVVADSSDTLTGGELLNRVSVLASTIKALGGERVALLADNGIGWIIADLACQQAQVSLLPIPTFFSSGQTRHAMEETGIDLLIVDKCIHWEETLLARQTLLQPGSGWLKYPIAPSSLELFYRPVIAGVARSALPESTGKITYTSGSTGTPKGVCLSNKQLVSQALALAKAVAIPGSRHLCLLPLSVLLENVAGVYTALVNGGTVIAPQLSELGFSGSSSLNGQKLLAAISRYQPETLILIPQLLSVLVQACEAGWTPPDSLRFIAVGGSKVSPGLIDSAVRYGLPVFEGYGLSECASVVSLNTPRQSKSASVGKPLSHLQVTCDNDEVSITGNPFLGYVGDPESWGQRSIASGDLGYLDDEGYLHLQGRRKNLLITSFGRNISPEWVESELTTVPLLQDVIVLGDSRPWLSALIYPRATDTTDSDIDEWIQDVNAKLPDYARIGGWIRLNEPLSSVEDLTTATGKPRRDAITAYFKIPLDQLYDDTYSEAVSQ